MKNRHSIKILFLLLFFIAGSVCARATFERFQIEIDKDTRVNRVYFTVDQTFEPEGETELSNRAVQIWRKSDSPDIDPLVLIARNLNDEGASFATFQLKNLNTREILVEDTLNFKLTDFEILDNQAGESKYLVAAGMIGDTAILVRHQMGSDRYDRLVLAVGKDRSGDGSWNGDVQLLVDGDYDLDGERELFLYVTTGRDLGPRLVCCVRPEPFQLLWEQRVSSVMSPESVILSPDSLNPEAIFTCFGPQNGAIDDHFNDCYGYLAALGAGGEVRFAKQILTDLEAPTIAEIDSINHRYLFYHNQPVGAKQIGDIEEKGHWLSVTDRDGNIEQTIAVDEMIKSIWIGAFMSEKLIRIFCLGLSGVVSVYDYDLNLIAQSNRSELVTYLGKLQLDLSKPPLMVFGGAGNLYLYDKSFDLQAFWPQTNPAIEPIAVNDRLTTMILLTGPTNGSTVKVHYRSNWSILVAELREHQELVLTILIILTIGLVITNSLRLRASNRLRAREQMLSAVFDNMQDGFYRTDINGKIIWASGATVRLLGDRDDFSPVGMNVSDFYVNPGKRKLLLDELNRNGRVTDWPVELKRSDGKSITVSTNSNIYLDKSGKPAGVEGAFRDISHRLEMERALRLSEEQYRSLVESAGEAIFSVDRDGKYLFMNSIAGRRLGGEPEQLIGKRIVDLFPPEIGERHMATVRKVFETGMGVMAESETVLKGEVRNYNTSLRPIRNDEGEIVSVLGIARDMTELVSARDRLALQEEFVGSLMDSANSLILCIDIEGKVSIFNSECERVTGLARFNVLDRQWEESFKVFLGDDQEAFGAWLKGDDSSFCETNITAGDGALRTILWSRTSVRSPGGVGESVLAIGQDISQRKQAETALGLSESKYRLLVENVGATISLINGDGVFHFINKVGSKELGVAADRVVGMTLHELFPPQMADKQLRIVADVLLTNKEHNGELFTSINGQWYWFQVHVQVYPERFEGEKVAIVIAHDITQRKEAEDSLRASEEKYRGIFDESVATVYLFDDSTRFVDSNQAGLDLLGCEREELLQMSISDVEENRGELSVAYADMLKGERLYNEEHRLVRKDGKVITVLNNSKPLTDLTGRVIGIQSTLIDISDRKAAEETLRHRLEIEQLAASISTEFLSLSDAQIDSSITVTLEKVGRFINADRGFLLRLIKNGTDLRVTHFWNAPHVEPVTEIPISLSPVGLGSWLDKLRKQGHVALRSQDDFPVEATAEREFFGKSGTKSNLTVPLKIQGEIIGALNFSCVKEAREWPLEDVRMLNVIGEVFVNALEQKRKSEEVARINQERIDQERQIAGGFAHELRNALFPARNMFDKLLANSSGPIETNDRELYSSLIDSSLTRASDIVGAILSYTRLGSQKRVEAVPVAEVVREVVEANRLLTETAGVKITTSGNDAMRIQSNRQQLFMVLNNLYINALDALEGIDEPRIDFEWREDANEGVITISDNGCGMSPETENKLFEPFYSTKPDKGTGLGLATVQKIVALYNGTISVQSEEGKGSVFVVRHQLTD